MVVESLMKLNLPTKVHSEPQLVIDRQSWLYE
jgi:hypothetical protein